MDRAGGAWESIRSAFGFLPGLAMLAGLILGFAVPALDKALGVELPVFAFDGQSAARGLLETIATVTVAVAGLAFSVTVVAFTLASSQLSPRVLRSFRRDRLIQAALAVFLGTFIYCLAVLTRLGGLDDAAVVPNLSITLAVVLALAAFGLFTAFIGHIVTMLQPSSVIAGIVEDAAGRMDRPFPSGIGQDPEDPAHAEAQVEAFPEGRAPVEASGNGYLVRVRGRALLTAARRHDALVEQRIEVGSYVSPGDVIAEIRGSDDPELTRAVRGAFELGRQRAMGQDLAFSVRQLADIALKGLSPGINDPTTAENAMDGLTAIVVRFAREDPAPIVRTDEDGRPRFVAAVPDLDDLVRLGFEQARVFAAPYPVVTVRMLEMLARIRREARRAGLAHDEVDRQAALLREGPDGEVPTPADVTTVQEAHHDLHTGAPGNVDGKGAPIARGARRPDA